MTVVLAPVDGSTRALRAVPWAAKLAGSRGTVSCCGRSHRGPITPKRSSRSSAPGILSRIFRTPGSRRPRPTWMRLRHCSQNLA